jgi:urease accessory protein UreE
VIHEEPSGQYLQAIQRAFIFAAETGSGCRPVHFLIGIAESESPAATALAPANDRVLRAVVTDVARTSSAPAGYLHMQVQAGARSLAASRGQQLRVEHLLVALLDQGTPEVLHALSQAGLDLATVREFALTALGLPAGQPAITFEPVTAAGTLDRPALPAAELDPRAWAVLRWRQDHLPISRLHRRWDTEALIHLERDAVWRLSDQLGLDDDQRFSLMRHHEVAVDHTIRQARADVARPGGETAHAEFRAQAFRRMRRRRHFPLLRFTTGWGAWLRNRRVQVWDRWFWLRTLDAYRGVPQP